jgi:hypothetical protein
MFKVKKKYCREITPNQDTIHYLQRIARLQAYQNLLSHNMIDCFIVDTDHKNGLEVHCINEYGLIYIYNLSSKRLITIIHPRPKQIKRYYQQLDLTTSKKIKLIIKGNHKRNTDHDYNEL